MRRGFADMLVKVAEGAADVGGTYDPLGVEGGAQEDVPELPHVAGPGMHAEHRECLCPEFATEFRGKPLKKVLREKPEVLGSLAEWRDVEPSHGEPVVEVEAEAPGLHGGTEVHMGRGDDPHVDTPEGLGADGTNLLLLDEPQERPLGREVEFGDLVEKERPVLGEFCEPPAVRNGAGEGTTNMAEELARREFARESRRVHRDERPGPARTQVVERTGDEFFPRPRLAGDEDREGVCRVPCDRRPQVAHRPALPDESRRIARGVVGGVPCGG